MDKKTEKRIQQLEGDIYKLTTDTIPNLNKEIVKLKQELLIFHKMFNGVQTRNDQI
jgi:uncharacterized protein YdcH (DUF465 family)